MCQLVKKIFAKYITKKENTKKKEIPLKKKVTI